MSDHSDKQKQPSKLSSAPTEETTSISDYQITSERQSSASNPPPDAPPDDNPYSIYGLNRQIGNQATGRLLAQRNAIRPGTVVELQRLIGNRAVNRLIQQQAQHPTSSPTKSQAMLYSNVNGSPNSPIAEQTTIVQRDPDAENQTYNINFQPPMGPPIRVQNVGREEAIRYGRRIVQRLRNVIEAGREGHQYLINIRREHWIVGAISDVASWVRLPEISIWNDPTQTINQALNQMEAHTINNAIETLKRAVEQINAANRAVIEYREGTITGAGRAITVLEVTEVAGAAAATVATGGVATGLVASAGVAAATAGTYGMLQNAAGQASSIGVGVQQHFDVRAMLQRGASDAIAGFVGALAGGALTRYLQRLMGSYLSAAGSGLSQAQFTELMEALGRLNGHTGPLPADYFMTTGQRIFTEFLGSVGTTPLTTAVTTIVNRLTGATRQMPSASEFAEQVFQELVQGGIMTLFISFLTHRMPARRSRSSSHNATPAHASESQSTSTSRSSGTSETPHRHSASQHTPSIIIEDPHMAAAARPATPEEAALLNRPQTQEQTQQAGRPLEPANPALRQQVRDRLRGRRWQDVMVETDAQGPQGQAFGDQMIHYRNNIMAEVQQRFQGEPAGTASTERTSDVDINLMGNRAGQNMQEAHQWLVENVGPDYSRMLRLDLLIDNSRSTTYRQVMGEMPPQQQQAMLNRLNNQAEILNLARMIQHAEHAQNPAFRERALGNVRELETQLGLSPAEIAQIHDMAAHPPSVSERNQLFNQIDALMRQMGGVQDIATRAQLAEQITLLQMRANFHMGEAYISPGAIRQTVQGQPINPAEAYQAALSHLEMFDHTVGSAHGDVVQAARGYELFKYMARFARAAQAAGINTPETTAFRHLGDYIYRANRRANEQNTNFIVDEHGNQLNLTNEPFRQFMETQHNDANRHEQAGNTDVPYYVTDPHPPSSPSDAQIAQVIQRFRFYVNEVLPQLRSSARNIASPPSQAPSAGAAVGNSTARNLAEENR